LLTKDGSRKVKDSDPLQGTIQDHEDGRRFQESEPVTPFICNWEDGRQVPETGVPARVITSLWQVTPSLLVGTGRLVYYSSILNPVRQSAAREDYIKYAFS
jgi:hypothetical protein